MLGFDFAQLYFSFICEFLFWFFLLPFFLFILIPHLYFRLLICWAFFFRLRLSLNQSFNWACVSWAIEGFRIIHVHVSPTRQWPLLHQRVRMLKRILLWAVKEKHFPCMWMYKIERASKKMYIRIRRAQLRVKREKICSQREKREKAKSWVNVSWIGERDEMRRRQSLYLLARWQAHTQRLSSFSFLLLLSHTARVLSFFFVTAHHFSLFAKDEKPTSLFLSVDEHVHVRHTYVYLEFRLNM